MSVNSSSSSFAFLPPSLISSFETLFSGLHSCLLSVVGTFGFRVYTITSILIIFPLCVLVLYLGLQRWRQQHSSRTMSHSDFFTYNIVIIELLNVLGLILTSVGIHTDLQQMIIMGIYLFALNTSAQLSFHTLTCVERYLAVVHPIMYLSLRNAKAIRMRNITTGCVWLICFPVTGLIYIECKMIMTVLYIFVTSFLLTIVSFCSFSVLWALVRPGPGEGGQGKELVAQSKLRVFYTVTAILGVLLLRFFGAILSTVTHALAKLTDSQTCGLVSAVFWLGLPSSLVSPLLFLLRARELRCSENNR